MRRLEKELVAVNDDSALLDGHPNEIGPEELDDSEVAVRQRAAEKVRREAIRGSLEQMSLYFKVRQPKYSWKRPQVLFFGESTALISKFIGHLPRSLQPSRIPRLAQEHSVTGGTSASQRPSNR